MKNNDDIEKGKPQLKTADKVLYLLLTKGYVLKSVLLCVGNQRSVYRAIDDFVKRGYVREKHIIEDTPLGHVTVDYLYLTLAGFAFVWKTRREQFPWLRAIPFADGLKPTPAFENAASAKRYLHVSATAAMLDAAGADEYVLSMGPPLGRSKDEENETLLTVSGATRIAFDASRRTQNKSITFFDALTVKRTILDEAARLGNNPPAISGGRFTGIVSGPHMTALTYFADKTNPLLIWRKRTSYVEFNAYTSFEAMRGHAAFMERKSAICIVANAEVFECIYQVSGKGAKAFAMKKPVKDKDAVKLGKGFGQFYIVPCDRTGIYELRALLTMDLEREKAGMMDMLLLDTNEFMANRDNRLFPKQFPLISMFDELYTVLLHLDVVELQGIEEALFATKGKAPHFIYCRSWMVPYLEAIFDTNEVSLEVFYDPFFDRYNEVPLEEREEIPWAVEQDEGFSQM